LAIIPSFVFIVFINFSAMVHPSLTALSTRVVVDKQHHTEAKNHTHSYIFLDKTMSTHYDVLNVSRSASMSEIKTAYHRILLKSHPDKTHMLGPFARSIADQKIRAANAAWEILSTPATKTAYDLSLPPLEQFGESAFESNTGFGSFGNGFGGGFGSGFGSFGNAFASFGNRSNQSKKPDQ
jgi:DnaJ-class molecular chaperone